MSKKDREIKQEGDALDEVDTGIDAKKKGDVDAAIKHFSKAMELDAENISSITNRLSAYYDIQKYNECIDDCIRAENMWQNLKVGAEVKAMVVSLKGLSYMNLAKYAKDFDMAIEAFEMAYKLDKTPRRLSRLEDARRAKEVLEKREQQLGDRERTLGNNIFKTHRSQAVKHYTRAIELNPCDAKAYCNRAFCYTLDGMLAEGLKDAEKCLELDPTFVRGYLRKGNIEFEKKQHSKALKTYEMGLKHGKRNRELHNEIRKCREQMSLDADKDTVKEPNSKALIAKQAKATLDPEIQTILSDPIMRQVLIDFQQNSSDAHEHAKNELVMQKIKKLLDADLL